MNGWHAFPGLSAKPVSVASTPYPFNPQRGMVIMSCRPPRDPAFTENRICDAATTYGT